MLVRIHIAELFFCFGIGAKQQLLFSELYLEELSDHIEDTNVECQTDAFLDKPATPLFTPAKSGKDVATQIEEGEVHM